MRVGGAETSVVRDTLAKRFPKARQVLALSSSSEAPPGKIAHTRGIVLSAAKMRLYCALAPFAAGYPGRKTAATDAGSVIAGARAVIMSSQYPPRKR
jgi:hypothetical protein